MADSIDNTGKSKQKDIDAAEMIWNHLISNNFSNEAVAAFYGDMVQFDLKSAPGELKPL